MAKFEDNPFTTGPVAGFEVDDVASARAEMEAAGVQFIGPSRGGPPAQYVVALIPNLFTVVVNAHAAGLAGPKLRATPDAGGGIQHIEAWEWTS